MLQFINEKIKKLYKNKASFCAENGYKYKDFSSKLKTLQNRFNWINEFIKPLGLKIYIDEDINN